MSIGPGRLHPLALLGCTALLTVMAGYGYLGPKLLRGHDTICHVVSTVEYARCFQDGVWWPRWLPDLSAGYGGPDPLFYAPLVFQVSGRLHAAGLAVPAALQLTALAALALSALGMLLWAGQVWRPAGAVLAATAYVFAPYHLCDLYVRCALPELVGMGLAPWLFWLVRRHADGSPHAWRWLAVLLAAMVGIHALSVVLYGGLLIVYALGLVAARRAAPAALIGGGGASVALAAALWVPVLAESSALWLVHNGFSGRTWPNSFLSLGQLADQPWQGAVGAMPLNLGWPMLILSALALLAALGLTATRAPGMLAWWSFALAVAVHVVLATTASRPLWEHSFLPLLEFPWRFLAPASLGLAMLVPVVLVPLERRPRLAPAASAALCLVFIVASAGTMRGEPDPTAWPTAAELRRTHRTATHYPMYVPAGARPTLFPGRERFALATGEGALSDVREASDRHRLHVSARSPLVLEARIYMYEGWRAWIDGRPAALIREDACGGMRLEVPPGEHEVELAFGTTPLRMLGLALTLTGAFFLVLRDRLSRAALHLSGVLFLACTLGIAYRRTPMDPNHHAEAARTLLQAQRYPEASAELAEVQTGTSQLPWVRKAQAELAANGVTVSCFPGGNLAAPPVPSRRLDLLFDPSVWWAIPSPPPMALTGAATLDVPVAGDYRFILESIGTAALAIDRARVAGGAPEHAALAEEGRARLTAGPHELALFYRSRGPEASLRVLWCPPGRPSALIPLSAVRPGPVLAGAALSSLPGFPGSARP